MVWVDCEWPYSLKMCLARLWVVYGQERRVGIRENVVGTEENFELVGEKRKLES